ncbi:MAG: hypothetical protein ACOC10_03245 [Bacteroidota bacterium]
MKTLHIIKSGIIILAITAAPLTSINAQKSANASLERQLARVSASTLTFTETKPVNAVYNTAYTPTFDVVVEVPIELEAWMTDTKSWAKTETEKLPLRFETEEIKDEDVGLETWMFNFYLPNDEDIVEHELMLESWMLSSDGWEF